MNIIKLRQRCKQCQANYFSAPSLVRQDSLEKIDTIYMSESLEYEKRLWMKSILIDCQYETDVEKFYEKERTKQFILKLIDTLPEMEARVISLRYFTRLRLAECGRILNVSARRVARIQCKALAKLRKRCATMMKHYDIEEGVCYD